MAAIQATAVACPDLEMTALSFTIFDFGLTTQRCGLAKIAPVE
jgi:hypothetical protein